MSFLMTYGAPLFKGTSQTVGIQTKTVSSFAIGINSVVNLIVYFTAANTAYTLARSGYLVGTAIRAAGNVVLQGIPILDAIGSLTTTIALAANTGTQSIDVNVTGVAATTVNWSCVGYPMVTN